MGTQSPRSAASLRTFKTLPSGESPRQRDRSGGFYAKRFEGGDVAFEVESSKRRRWHPETEARRFDGAVGWEFGDGMARERGRERGGKRYPSSNGDAAAAAAAARGGAGVSGEHSAYVNPSPIRYAKKKAGAVGGVE